MLRAVCCVVLLLLGGAVTAEELARSEQKERVAKLSEQHRQFLLDVEPILSPAERDAFLRLETGAQRDAFIEDFWRRRDIARGTTNHAARAEYLERLAYVKEHFGAAASDRGRAYLLRGPPSEIFDVDCSATYQPIQIWKYEYLEDFGHDFWLVFYVPRGHREYRVWQPIKGRLSYLAYQDLLADVVVSSGPAGARHCKNGDILAKALAVVQDDADRIPRVFQAPPVNAEDVGRILRSAVIGDPGAAKLSAEMRVAYEPGDGAKTDARITILVPRAQLKTTTAGGVSVYTIDVVGEVLRGEAMWEKYRYRFDFPGDAKDEQFPIVIDRLLRPAEYRSRVKITDAASNAQTILEGELNVPEVAAPKNATLEAVREELESVHARLRIVPLPESVMSGVQTIETIVSGNGIKAVEFWLDGQKVATRRAPPYTLDLDFGTVPKARRIRAVALDAHGRTITGDEVVVNTGTDPFRVRIASPRIAPKVSGPTRVEVEVRIPEGKQLASLDLYYNEQRVATMYDPPFVQTVHIPATDGVGYLRAVAMTEEESVEDVVMVNTPEFMHEIDVHLVELPATVLRDGKPVNDLTEKAFEVLDEGQPVKLAKFEHVRNLPLSLGMAVDTSGSMTEKMDQARAAGAAFFQNVMRRGDKAFIVAFDSQPHLVQKWSNELTELSSGLAKLRPEESTALYDAVVYSLYNFHGVKGQKALILLTDGKDTISKFSYEQALEYAQRAAVPIYAVGIGIGSLAVDVRSKLNRLCTETGGTSYYIDAASELTKIYTDIQNELRSQYLLGFYPQAKGTQWREVSVKVAEGKVKTIRGYYP